MERSRLTRSTAPLSRKSGAPTSFLGAGLFIRLRSFLERSNREGLLAQPHQNHVDRHPVQPGRESRFPPEGADLAEELEESLLQQVLGIRWVAHHAQAEGVNAATVKMVEKVERGSVPGLSQADGFRFRQRRSALTLACLGSVGRIRANGPVAAHPNRRMRQIPFRVVPKLRFVSQR